MMATVQNKVPNRSSMARMQCPNCAGWLQYLPSNQELRGNCLHCGHLVSSPRQQLMPIPAFGARIVNKSSEPMQSAPAKMVQVIANQAPAWADAVDQKEMITLRETVMKVGQERGNPALGQKEFVANFSTPPVARKDVRSFDEADDASTPRKKVSRMAFLFGLMGLLTIFAGGIMLLTTYQESQPKGIAQLVGLAKKIIYK